MKILHRDGCSCKAAAGSLHMDCSCKAAAAHLRRRRSSGRSPGTAPSRRRDCHFTDSPLPIRIETPAKGREGGGAAEWLARGRRAGPRSPGAGGGARTRRRRPPKSLPSLFSRGPFSTLTAAAGVLHREDSLTAAVGNLRRVGSLTAAAGIRHRGGRSHSCSRDSP